MISAQQRKKTSLSPYPSPWMLPATTVSTYQTVSMHAPVQRCNLALPQKRHPRFPCMVRHLFRLHPQESPILYWPSCKIHSLEVCLPCPCVTSWIQLMIFAIRQTVFYTPNTITISEGETIEGTLSCAPNARNNRDLDITIGWTAPHGQTETVNYKMCVVLSIYYSPFSLSRSISTLIPPPSPFLPSYISFYQLGLLKRWSMARS